jgi:hypothetical protein
LTDGIVGESPTGHLILCGEGERLAPPPAYKPDKTLLRPHGTGDAAGSCGCSTVAMFYVILFSALAVLLVVAGVTAVSRQRRRYREAGIDYSAPDEEEEDL